MLDSPRVKAGPGVWCTLNCIHSKNVCKCFSDSESNTWSGGLSVTVKAWRPGKSTRTSFWELKKKKTTNFSPFIVNLKEHCDLQLSQENLSLKKKCYGYTEKNIESSFLAISHLFGHSWCHSVLPCGKEWQQPWSLWELMPLYTASLLCTSQVA